MNRDPAPEIKSPCPMPWHAMRGDARARCCDHCQLHVHNLSAMSQRQVKKVLGRRGVQPVCISYTRRGDGTMVTRWDNFCDALLRRIQRGFAWSIAASAPVLLSGCQTQNQTLGEAAAGAPTTGNAEAERCIVTGGV